MPSLRLALNFCKILLISLLLAACATTKSTQISKDTNQIEVFSFKGRASISGDLIQNPGQGQISWKQNKNEIDIVFTAPLGQGQIEIDYVEGSRARLIINHKKEYFAETPDLLLQNIIGQDWPITGLQNWVLGLPSYPSRSRITRDFATNQIIKIEEDGWIVEYLEWDTYKGYSLPKRLNIIRLSTKIKLLIESWSIQK